MRYRTLAIAFSLCMRANAFQGVPVLVRLLPAQQTLVPGQPVVVTLELLASKAVIVDLGAERIKKLHFTFTDPSGKTAKLPLMMQSFGKLGEISLDSGRPYRQTINLTPGIEAYVFDENDDHPDAEDHPTALQMKLHPHPKTQWLGQYTIALRVDSDAASNAIFEQAAPITITVTPKDDARLRLVCENLRLRIQNNDERWEAESELLEIHDPVAVPYLRALLGGGIDCDIIRTLTRIGNQEAVDAIQTALSSRDPGIAEEARDALQFIQSYPKDEATRQRAADALKSVPASPR